MPSLETTQSGFTSGELSPTAQGRIDIEQYAYGLAKCQNALTLTEGALRRRYGLEWLTDIRPEIFIGTEVLQGEIINNDRFEFDATEFDEISAFEIEALQAISYNSISLYGVGSDGTTRQIASGVLFGTLEVGQKIKFELSMDDYSFDRYWIETSGDLGFEILTTNIRLTATEVTTLPDLQNVRLIHFQFNQEQTYKMVLHIRTLFIYLGTEIVATLDLPTITTDDIVRTLGWSQQADTLLITHPDIKPIRIVRMRDDVKPHSNWEVSDVDFTNIPRFAFGGETATAGNSIVTGLRQGGGRQTLTFASNPPISTANLVGQYIEITANGVGRMEVTERVSNTQVRVKVLTDLDHTSENDDRELTIPAGEWELQTGYEPIWSETKGYPRRSAFYQGRLWVDGGRSLPSFLYGSVVNSQFDFDFGSADDSDAIGALQGSFDEIEAIQAGRRLSIFSNGGEYIVPQVAGEALTPRSVTLVNQTSKGSLPNLRPQETDGGILFIDRRGGSVQQFLFDEVVDAFSSNNISLLSSHLVSTPVDFALRKEINTTRGAYVMIVREDGGLTLGNYSREQQVASFVDAKLADGATFLACQSDIDEMYFVIRDSEGNLSLQRFREDFTMDFAVERDMTNGVISDIAHLNGRTAKVIGLVGDEYVYLGQQEVADGTITFDNLPPDAPAKVQVGIDFEMEVITLPVAFQPAHQIDSVVSRRMSLVELTLHLNESYDCYASVLGSDRKTRFPKPSQMATDRPRFPLFDGCERRTGFRGWMCGGQIKIGQVYPLPLTILQIQKRLQVR